MTVKPKSNSTITSALSPEGSAIVFTVRDRAAVKGTDQPAPVVDKLELRLTSLSETVRQRAMIHGLIQRVSDAAALSRDPKTGKEPSALDKLAAMQRLVDHYNSGTEEWNIGRAASGPRWSDDQRLLAKCLREVYPDRTEERVAEFVLSKKPSEVLAVLRHESISEVAERLRSHLAAEVDAEELLSEF